MLSRATDILRLLGLKTSGLSLGQIAGDVQLPRSTVQRIVTALAAEGFVTIGQGHGSIRLGPEIQNIAQNAAFGMQAQLRPVMQRIVEDTGETVDLAILEGRRMRFIDQIVGSQRLRTVSSIGEAFPLTTTANGKAALACMEHAHSMALMTAELEAAGRSDDALTALVAEITLIRQGGLARDENEHTDGICALGFALKDHRGDIFALSTPVPSTRFERVQGTLSEALLRGKSELVK